MLSTASVLQRASENGNHYAACAFNMVSSSKSFVMGRLSALCEYISYAFLPHVKPNAVSHSVRPSTQMLPFMIPLNKSKLVPASNYQILEQFQCLPSLLHGEPF